MKQRRVTERLSAHRVLAATLFDKLCALTGMTNVDLCHVLERELARNRGLQPSTLRAWRRGRQGVPLDALLVRAELTRFRFPGVELLLLGETIDDEERRREAFAALANAKRGPSLSARPISGKKNLSAT